jgi:uncharacterized GH25 family protein
MLVILKDYHLSLREYASAAIDDNQRVFEKYDKIHIVSLSKPQGTCERYKMMKTIQIKKGPRRYIKHRVLRAKESIRCIVSSIYSRAAADKIYAFGYSKVVITMGSLSPQHELITQ